MSVDYVQTTPDPGACGAGKMWLNDTTQELKVRDATNSNWIIVANLAQTRGGNIPVSGGVLTGPITGSHGLAGLDSPAFTTAAKLDGRDLARITDLSNMRKEILASMNSRVQEIISRASGSSIVNNIAFEVVKARSVTHSGVGVTSFQVALPKYPDGTDATEAQIRGYGAAFEYFEMPAHAGNIYVELTDLGGRNYSTYIANGSTTGTAGGNYKVASWILCTR